MSSSLYTVVLNQTIEPLDINQIVQILSQPSGGLETAQYWLAFEAYGNGAIGSLWIQSQSRNNAPVSVTKDESLQAHNNCGAIQIQSTFYYSGVQLYSFSDNAGAHPSCNVAGVYTLHY